MKTLFFALLSLVCLSASAQTLHFCAAYGPDGTPMGESKNWNIYEGGGNVYLLFKNDKPIAQRGISITIMQVFGDSVEKVHSELIMPDGDKDWGVVDYHFANAGDYKVTATLAGSTLDSQKLTISYLRKGTDYTSSAMQFCTRVSDGAPSDTLTSVKLENGVAKARAFLACPDGLSCDKITVDVWKRQGSDFSKFVATQEFEVEPGWLFTQFQHQLQEAGRYRFMVYSDSGVWINSAELTVE
jgi:hypothetical protein